METELVNKAFGTAVQLIELKWPFLDLGVIGSSTQFLCRDALFPHVLQMYHVLKETQKKHDMARVEEQIADLFNDTGLYVVLCFSYPAFFR